MSVDEGERTLFAESVRAHVSAMARLAARLAPAGDRDDIVQEALSRAWKKRGQFDPRRGSVRSWLLAITADQARQVRRRRFLPIRLEPPMARSSAEERVDLEEAIKHLPPRQRLAVDCFYFVGLSVAETAAVMHCAEGTVKSCLSDARARLRQLLEDSE